MPDGTKLNVDSEVFRFVVVDLRNQLLRLGEQDGYIYCNVSKAATEATGSQTNGYAFFELNRKKIE